MIYMGSPSKFLSAIEAVEFASYRQGLISHLWQYARNAGFQVYKTDLDLRA